MSKGTLCGAFMRHGALIGGRIGRTAARWDRQHGGALTVACRRGRGHGPSVAFTTRLRVLKGNHPWTISQANDPDPRVVFCEEGPERLVLRVMYALLDDRGGYHGDGVSDTVLWANGDVHVASAVRLVDLTAHDTVTDAWLEARLSDPTAAVEVGTRAPKRVSPGRLDGPQWLRFKSGVPGRYALVRSRSACVAFSWFSDECTCYEALGGVGAWAGPGNEPPYYDRWGHLYDQWGGPAGWNVHETSRLGLAADGEGLSISWHWLHDAAEPVTANMPWRGLVALHFCERPGDARERVEAFLRPALPRAEGAEFRCLDALENTLVYRKTDEVVKLTFNRDPLARTAHLRVYGLRGTGGVVIGAPGEAVVPHLVSHGGRTDDPYGPNHVRPADRHAPMIGDPNVPPDELVLSVPLSRRGRTVVTVREVPGINLSYLKWDDRRTFILRASARARPLAEFSFQTLCLHNLRARDEGEPGLLRLPLYWYVCNTSTPFHTLNLLDTFRLVENGPEALHFEVSAVNRGQGARSTMRVVIPADAVPTVRVKARLDVLRQWDLPEIQYLNAFPENSWQPEDWPADWVVLVDAAGRTMERFFKERLEGQRRGDPITQWRDQLVLVQGACRRGNVFVHAANVSPEGQEHTYRLCGVWLDSHLSVAGLKAPVPAGSSFEADYVLALWGDQGLTRARAIEIARRSIEARALLMPKATGRPAIPG